MRSEDEVYLHVYEVIEGAVQKALGNLTERPNGVPVQEFRPWGETFLPEDALRLRLDLDLEGRNEDEGQFDFLVSAVTQQASYDLADMLVNGDRDKLFDYPTHSLLGLVDGIKKTGKELVSIEVLELLLFHQYVEKKESTEYTGYFAVRPHWEQ